MTAIRPTVPFEAAGKHHGFLRPPHSRSDSAWGSVMIPVTVIRSGAGPTALMIGANHGDEYEGPIARQTLALEIAPEEVTGRILLVPHMHLPVFRAGTRLSPIDAGNRNRAFPGGADGLIEPLVDLGEEVARGAPLARIWPADRTGQAPLTCTARRAGVPAARHFPGLVQAGDCLAVIASQTAEG